MNANKSGDIHYDHCLKNAAPYYAYFKKIFYLIEKSQQFNCNKKYCSIYDLFEPRNANVQQD